MTDLMINLLDVLTPTTCMYVFRARRNRSLSQVFVIEWVRKNVSLSLSALTKETTAAADEERWGTESRSSDV